MEFADPATVARLDAEVVALIAERGCNGKEAMEIVLHRRGMRCIVPAGDNAGAELWRLPDGRSVTVWWESQYGQARAVTDPTAWENAAVGFDNQELLWEEEIERQASEDV